MMLTEEPIDLTKSEARAIEHALICVYTIEALSNARYEIEQKNYKDFEEEFRRAANIAKIPLDDLYDAMNKR